VQPREVGGRERARGERLDSVLRHAVRDDGAELAGARVEEVCRGGLCSRQPGELVADEPEALGQVGGRADDARDSEEPARLAKPGFELLPGLGRCPGVYRSRRAWNSRRAGGCPVRGAGSFCAHHGYRPVYRDGTS
jgi:hypothetical protein